MKRFLGTLRLCLLVLCIFAPAVVYALPDSYERLEYIQSSGTQYINTGFVPSADFKHTLVFEVFSASSSNKYVCGTGSSVGRAGNVRISNSVINGIWIGQDSSANAISGNKSIKGRVKLVMDLHNNAKNTIMLEGQNISNNTMSSVISGNPMHLFASGGAGVATGVRIYSSTIEQNGVVIHRFIPVKRKSDNVIGMYDVMNSNPATAFHTNAGTGKFIAGPEVGIKIATKAYNDSEFESVQTALTNARTTVSSVVSNTITQTGSIGTLATSKQNRPTTNCPQYRQCMLVQDANNQPQWFPIVDPFYDLFKPMIAQSFDINIHGSKYDMGYTQLDYIQSSGTQWINTNVSGLNSGEWEIYAKWLMSNVTQGTYAYVIGAYQSENHNSYRIITNKTANNSYYVSGNSKAGGGSVLLNNIAANTIHTGLIRNGSVIVDGSNHSTPTKGTAIPASNTIGLFRSGIGTSNIMKGRIYESWATKNGEYQYHMFPAQQKSTGAIGMYDTVSGAFFGNSGTGDFTYGATIANTDVPSEPTWSVIITGNETGNTTGVSGTVYGTATCNSLSATANDVATSSNLSSSSWTTAGNNCWCSIKSVDANGNAGIHENPAWVFNENNSNCASQCSQLCTRKFIDGANGAFRSALSGIQ